MTAELEGALHVFLTGFMGSGKTTVGGLLAERLGLPFVDLDDEIVARAGRSVREIFAAEGEAGFRRLEVQALRAVTERPPAVVATGGGTVTQPASLALLKQRGLVVWLHPPFAVIAGRIGGRGKLDRPLFTDDTQALELYRRRLPAYRQAHLEVPVAPSERPEEVAARTALLIQQSKL